MTDDKMHELAAAMCLTWRHDFLVQREPGDHLSSGTTQQEREYLHGKMLELIRHHWPKEPAVPPSAVAESEVVAWMLRGW